MCTPLEPPPTHPALAQILQSTSARMPSAKPTLPRYSMDVNSLPWQTFAVDHIPNHIDLKVKKNGGELPTFSNGCNGHRRKLRVNDCAILIDMDIIIK
jgi:hypothetical protein